jgi:carbamoyl-phosphate synthase large subunit
MKVLLTGGGGASTSAVLKSLVDLGYDVLSADASLYAAGYSFATRGFVVPFATDPAFEAKFREILDEERPDFVIPLVDEEIAIVHRIVARHFAPAMRVIAPRLEFCEEMLDKWVMYERLAAAGLSVARTWLASDAGSCVYPAIIKPRTGRGSRGLAYLEGPRDLARYLLEAREPHDRYVVQERIVGTEYTNSVVVGLDGAVLAVVPKEVLAKKGITQLGVTRANRAMDKLGRDIQEHLRADGPFNVQLMLREDGVPFVFEINPRYSTTTVLTMAAGVNELDEVMRRARGLSQGQLTFEPDLMMIRHATQIFVREAEWKPDDRRGTSLATPAAVSRKRVLVTGASGFLGTALVPRLVSEGYDVTALGRTHTPPSTVGTHQVETRLADLADVRASGDVLSPWRWDAVVNLAAPVAKGEQDWPDSANTVASHVAVALNLTGAIPDWWEGRLVHVSSMVVYGLPDALPVREDHARRPIHAYGLAKRLAEDVVLASRARDRWVLRVGGLFAEERRSGALFHFARAAVRGEALRIDAKTPLAWELLHLEDAVEAIVRALRAPGRDPGAVNIGYGDPVQFDEVARSLATRAGKGSAVVNEHSVSHPTFRADISGAKRLLTWPPSSLAQRVDRFLAHHASEARS